MSVRLSSIVASCLLLLGPVSAHAQPTQPSTAQPRLYALDKHDFERSMAPAAGAVAACLGVEQALTLLVMGGRIKAVVVSGDGAASACAKAALEGVSFPDRACGAARAEGITRAYLVQLSRP